jgi:hypothetical protein
MQHSPPSLALRGYTLYTAYSIFSCFFQLNIRLSAWVHLQWSEIYQIILRKLHFFPSLAISQYLIITHPCCFIFPLIKCIFHFPFFPLSHLFSLFLSKRHGGVFSINTPRHFSHWWSLCWCNKIQIMELLHFPGNGICNEKRWLLFVAEWMAM